MNSRDDQIDKMAATMKQWAAEMDKYEAQLQQATAAQREQVEAYMADLRKRYAEAEEHMKTIRASSEAASHDMLEGFQRMADDFMAALNKARDRF